MVEDEGKGALSRRQLAVFGSILVLSTRDYELFLYVVVGDFNAEFVSLMQHVVCCSLWLDVELVVAFDPPKSAVDVVILIF